MHVIASSVILSVVAATAIGLPAAAQAVPAADKPGTTTIVLYAENRSLARVEEGQVGADHGDVVMRELALSRSQAGPVIGVSFSQSTIVAYNPQAQVDIRRVDTQKKLPGGMLLTQGLTRLPIGTVPQPGWADTYAVIGGTGKFAGARGTERLTLLEDGKTFKVVITLMG
jgi:hypothetical protein